MVKRFETQLTEMISRVETLYRCDGIVVGLPPCIDKVEVKMGTPGRFRTSGTYKFVAPSGGND